MTGRDRQPCARPAHILTVRRNGTTWTPVPTNTTGNPAPVTISADTANSAWLVGTLERQ